MIRKSGYRFSGKIMRKPKGDNKMNTLTRRLLIAAAASLAFAGSAIAQDKSIVVASTTSTQDSGLFEHILPLFKAKTGIDVKVIALGTGQALDTARRGDADVVFVHAKSAEEKFLSEGFGVKRYPVMYNDFVLIGPKSDPAGVKGTKDIVAALQTIKTKAIPFISRGDKSGTHIAEVNLWKIAGVDIRSEEHTSELQSQFHLVCRLLLEKKNKKPICNPGDER